MIVTTKTLFEHAYGKYAVGAYNINNAEQAMGLFQGSIDSQSPFIIQISKGARSYTDKRMLEAIIRACDEIFPESVFAVHLDHGDEKTALLTDPNEAKEFIERSGADSLACAIGTSHGAYKFSGGQGLHFERIEAIQKAIPGVPLVMHGSSSVPQDEVQRINNAGGKLKEGAKGVDENQYLPAAKLGVCKVNIDTDGRLVWTRVHREFFQSKPEDFDLRSPGKVFMAEYAKFIASRSILLGSAGQLASVRELAKTK